MHPNQSEPGSSRLIQHGKATELFTIWIINLLLKAITLAGGTTDRAAEKRVQIMRTDENGDRVQLIVNLRKVKRGRAEDPILREDDIVLVPEGFF